ncbi:fungal-specific transcription factor domain-containing protein [Massariosphaeria phaeospora]|uniref:Fungal-specific transcription factor domain-containing protein n=1 Tax=Massariosphaeria phaeospora TaxID=100035 RepID=A0A7C8I6M2_9PLEO|nr:fungal-specific transcription factor domain-containing protein [Massariosphaeria phaeospora]
MNPSPTQPYSLNEPEPLPLRVDMNTGKSRSLRPCDSCRRRKSRCEIADGGVPCVLCHFHQQECTFLEEPQPRKRKATTLSEEDNVLNTSSANISLFTEKSRSVGLSPTNAPQVRQAQTIDDYADLRGPSLLKKTLGLQYHRHSRLIGSTSQYERLLLQVGDFCKSEDTPVGSSVLRKVNDLDAAFLLTPDADTRTHQDEISDLDSIEALVAPHNEALIHLYFRIVHPSFPILHKKVFLEKYQRTHREFAPPLLAAVYILALSWWSYSSELALLPKPDVAKLEQLASKTMNDIIQRPKLSTIQAGLLLLQRPEGDSWALTTQLVGIGQDLGLHLDCSDWRIPSWERGLRKRLAWALYMQDKWGSLVHGRPSHITTSDWRVKPVQEGDFPENAADEDDEDGSTEVERGRALFCEMIKLTEILALLLSTFYTIQAEDEIEERAPEGVRWLLEKAKPIQLSLRQWYSSLPPSLKMEVIAMRKLSSTGYLHLGYYTVEITLHRRIIRSISSADNASLRTICRKAAQARLSSAMEFVQNLRAEHLQSFWYSASKYSFALIGTFISLLWVTALEKEEAESYKAKLDEYRWNLMLSSKSADFIERAITMLATSSGVLVKSIPSRPDIGFILNRHSQRAVRNSSSARDHPETTSQVQSTGYQSESEWQDDNDLENAILETPSRTNTAVRDWRGDQLWFANVLNTTEDAFGNQDMSNPTNNFLAIPEVGDGDGAFNF